MKYSILFFLLCILSSFSIHETITGKVIGIMDGDTIEVLTKENKTVKIRLAHIDCPEKKQAYGNVAKKFTSSLCYLKEVKVIITSYDRNKRAICEVYADKTYINLEIVKAGYAWHFKKYSKNKNIADAEIIARNQKLGLWNDKNPISPWDFRKAR